MSSKFHYALDNQQTTSSQLQNHHHQLSLFQMHHQQQQHHHSHQTTIPSASNRQKCQQQPQAQQQGNFQQLKYSHPPEFHQSFESFLQTSAAAIAIQQQQPMIYHKHQNSQMGSSKIICDDGTRSGSNNRSLIAESGDQEHDEQSSCGYGPVIENDEMDCDNDVDDESDKKCSNSYYNSSFLFKEDFIINHTPSRQNGISYANEVELRRKGTKFIRDLTQLLKMKPICRETAYVYFHRFFMLRSFSQYDPIRIAMASLYFACKYEDHPLPKDHLIQVSYMLINNYTNKQQYKLNKDDKEYIEYCDRLIRDENLLIQLLGFNNLRISHFQKLLIESDRISGTTKELYKVAYQIGSELNRLTTLCLEHSAPFLAAVSLYLAAYYRTIRLPDDWHLTIIKGAKNPSEVKKLVIQIGEKYREQLVSSQLIQKLLSDEYKNLYGSPTKSRSIEQKQHPALGALLMTNFSPDSAYSSSSSTTAAYSPAEIQQHSVSRHSSDDRKNRSQASVERNVKSMLNPVSVVGSHTQQDKYSINNSGNYQILNNMNPQQNSKKRSICNLLGSDNHINDNNEQFNFAQQQSTRKIDHTSINTAIIQKHSNNNQLSRNLQSSNLSNKKFKTNQTMIELNNEFYQNRSQNGNNNNRQQLQQQQQQLFFPQENAAYAIQQQLGLMFQQHHLGNASGIVGNNNMPIITDQLSFQQQQHRKNM